MSNVTHALLNHVIDDVFRRKENHHRLYVRLRFLYMVMRTIIHIMNAVSITTLVITFYGESIVLIVCATTSSISTMLTTVSTALRLNDRVHNHHNSYVRYKALHDRFRLLALRAGYTEEELQHIVSELNDCIGLILDRSEPISISSRRFIIPVCHGVSVAHLRESSDTIVTRCGEDDKEEGEVQEVEVGSRPTKGLE
jgi:hypothetical protein